MNAAEFERRFAAALLGREDDPALAAITGQPGFAVYRNTVIAACIDALAANFPAVQRLVGEDWFRAAASVYVRAQPPRDGRLVGYGEGFAGFLAGFPPARELPWLADVARLDRWWTESHLAADGPVLDAAALGTLPVQGLAALRLRPHAAARWGWFPAQPVFTLWSRQREAVAPADGIDWHGEGALLARPDGVVRWCTLDAAGCALLDGLEIGRAHV